MADRWRLTQFISEIVAPLASSARFTACFSSMLMPGAGRDSSVEPTPEIKSFLTSLQIRHAKSKEAYRAAA